MHKFRIVILTLWLILMNNLKPGWTGKQSGQDSQDPEFWGQGWDCCCVWLSCKWELQLQWLLLFIVINDSTFNQEIEQKLPLSVRSVTACVLSGWIVINILKCNKAAHIYTFHTAPKLKHWQSQQCLKNNEISENLLGMRISDFRYANVNSSKHPIFK